MNIPHNRITDTGFEACDGDMIDIGTFTSPNRMLCTKCRAVRVRTADVIDVEEMGPRNAEPASPPTLWQKILRWIW